MSDPIQRGYQGVIWLNDHGVNVVVTNVRKVVSLNMTLHRYTVVDGQNSHVTSIVFARRQRSRKGLEDLDLP
jgi:hypothetical protein